jgi:CubicO group peptidase (beta-lactamase class C family)
MHFYSSLLLVPLFGGCASPKLAGVGAAMQAAVDAREISGAVAVVVTKNKVIHLETTGLADIAAKMLMRPDTLFWIASMTKPITAVSILMLQDEGKLNVTDPIAKYIPEFASLKTPSGQPANITIALRLPETKVKSLEQIEKELVD